MTAQVDSEHPLFVLYTSGSTGKPKGVLHTTGGYMVYTATTSKYVFDLQPVRTACTRMHMMGRDERSYVNSYASDES